MATVTILFRDEMVNDEGVHVELRSDPPYPEKHDDCTEAQRMAFGLLHMLDEHMKSAENAESKCPVVKNLQHNHTKDCDGNGGCGGKHEKEGTCAKHKDTPPDKCCQHED